MLNQTLDLGLHEKKNIQLRGRKGEIVGFAWMDLSLSFATGRNLVWWITKCVRQVL